MRIQKFALSALLLALPLSATANDAVGVYVSGKLGSSIQRQTDKVITFSNPEVSTQRQEDSTKNTVGGGFAVGYDFNSAFNAPFRAELEYYTRAKKQVSIPQQMPSDSAASKVSTQTLMANAYWDIHTEIEGFKPFVTAGLGAAFNKMNLSALVSGAGIDIDQSKSKNQFAWSVGAGVGYEFSKSWVVELGYRYLNAGKSTDGFYNGFLQNVKIDINNEYHDFTLGLRYTF